jgi:hypothetical protein
LSVLLKTGETVEDARLDRLVTPHSEHLDHYPLTARTLPAKSTSMVAGTNWYRGMDRPFLAKIRGRNRYVIGTDGLGPIRGGHAFCLRNWNITDLAAWWVYYNQGQEGRCVEFAWDRAATHANRIRYDITSRWPYIRMQQMDEWAGQSPEYEGTSVNAGGRYMRDHGPVPAFYKGAPIPFEMAPSLARRDQGIEVYRWARDWSTVRAALEVPDWLPGVPFNNSWGKGYPHEVILLDELGERLLAEDGEMAIFTDR